MSKNEESVGFTGIQFIMKVMIEYVYVVATRVITVR